MVMAEQLKLNLFLHLPLKWCIGHWDNLSNLVLPCEPPQNRKKQVPLSKAVVLQGRGEPEEMVQSAELQRGIKAQKV